MTKRRRGAKRVTRDAKTTRHPRGARSLTELSVSFSCAGVSASFSFSAAAAGGCGGPAAPPAPAAAAAAGALAPPESMAAMPRPSAPIAPIAP